MNTHFAFYVFHRDYFPQYMERKRREKRVKIQAAFALATAAANPDAVAAAVAADPKPAAAHVLDAARPPVLHRAPPAAADPEAAAAHVPDADRAPPTAAELAQARAALNRAIASYQLWQMDMKILMSYPMMGAP